LITESVDPRGNTTTYTYDAAGNQRSKVTPDGGRTTYAYDAVGRLTSVIDPRGNASGADPKQYTTRYEYDAADRLAKTFLPGRDKPWQTGYDSIGQTVQRVDTLGNVTTYRYSARVPGRLTTTVDRVGGETTYTYTAAGRAASSTDPVGGRTTWTYNSRGDVATVVSPRGNLDGADRDAFTTSYVYDPNGNPLRTSQPDPAGGVATSQVGYDALNRQVSTTDPLGAVTEDVYDETGNVISTVDPLGGTSRMSYDEDGRPQAGTTAAGGTSKLEYDKAGNLVKQVSATGGTTTWTYDAMNRVATMVEPRGNADGADPAEYTTTYDYDRVGNLDTVTDPLGHATSYRYDVNNRLVSAADAKAHTTRYAYDDGDRLVSVTGPDVADPSAGATRYQYDAEGRLTHKSDANGHTTEFTYDRAGRLKRALPPLGYARQYGYDANGNLTSIEAAGAGDRAARTITDTYDSRDRRTERRLGPSGPRYTYGFDAANRLVGLSSPTVDETRGYDAQGALISVTIGSSVFRYEHNDDGDLTARIYPDGTEARADYDFDGRMTSLAVSGGVAGPKTATYRFAYDPAGRPTTTHAPGAAGLVTRREYDRAGQLSELTTRNDGGVVAGYDVNRDAAGNPTWITTTRGEAKETARYGYDAADRLLSACYGGSGCADAAGSATYTYDRVGNRLTEKRAGSLGAASAQYRYDNADQLTQSTRTTASGSATTDFGYDDEGNLTRAGADAFGYNLDHTMSTAKVGGASTTFGYDAQGLQVAADSTKAGVATHRSWTWDMAGSMPRVATETTTSGGDSSSRGLLAGAGATPLALLAGETDSLVPDATGSVAALADASGEVATTYDYDPFGTPRTTSASSGDQDLGAGSPVRFGGVLADCSFGGR
jgi:YD repeat-containing protein